MKIQPNEFAKNGSTTAATPIRQNHGEDGIRPPRNAHRPISETSAASAPKPIINRKPQ